MAAESRIVERDGSKLVEVTLLDPLPDDVERWFWQFLDKQQGMAYVTCNSDTMKMIGYGVWMPWWENFRFWLAVSIEYADLRYLEIREAA